MKVYIVRNGEVPHNALKIYNNENEDLNENGVIQAETLKSKIKDLYGYLRNYANNILEIEYNNKGQIKKISINKENIKFIRLAIKF